MGVTYSKKRLEPDGFGVFPIITLPQRGRFKQIERQMKSLRPVITKVKKNLYAVLDVGSMLVLDPKFFIAQV